MKKIAVLFLGLSLNIQGQDPVFTNAQQSLVALNPSFAGSNGLIRYQSNTRMQWMSLPGSYQTYYNSVDAFIKPMNGGFALAYSRDDQAKGTLITDRIDLTYAQHFNLLNNKLKIIPSLQVSVFRKTLDRHKMVFGDQIEPRRGFTDPWGSQLTQSKSNVDFSSGLIINYNHFYIGTTAFHFTQPDEGLQGPSKLPLRSSSFISYNFVIGENILLNPMLRYEQQKSFSNIQFNINALFLKHVMVSTGYRNNNTMNAFVGFRHHYFTVSGGYEFSVNNTSPNSAGTYEIAASLTLRNKEDRKLVKDFERW
ncbi:MAG: PorP/SprF family type IX secretion system membrane protein [Bacteroidota bacterium]